MLAAHEDIRVDMSAYMKHECEVAWHAKMSICMSAVIKSSETARSCASGALLRMLSAPGGLTAQQDQQQQQHRRPLSSRELAHVAQLAAFFGDLVSELVGAVQHLALLDFNDWLVRYAAVRLCILLVFNVRCN